MLGVSSRTGSTTGTAYFTRDPNGTMVTDRDPSGSYYYIHDALGSVIALTDSTGAVAKSYSYDPFGKTTTGAGSLAQYFRYAGGLLPTATAPVTKFGRRYYDPETGRWTQLDPIEQAGSLREGNLYLYVGDDPINFVDPSGLCFIVSCSVYHAAGSGLNAAGNGLRAAGDWVETNLGKAGEDAAGCIGVAAEGVEFGAAGVVGGCLVGGAAAHFGVPLDSELPTAKKNLGM
jgi:RHS repeat-associated protein